MSLLIVNIMVIDLSVKKRFFEKVNICAPRECWEWQASFYKCGYGQFSMCIDGSWRPRQAHRMSWIIHCGQIPQGLLVCHSCDNKKCVNPHHLFLGTHKDNLRDMSSKGRSFHQQKTHCPKGHAYNEKNTSVVRGNSGLKIRRCKECKKIDGRARYWKDREPYKLKTHCVNGHEFTEENTRVFVERGSTKRRCRTCERGRRKSYQSAHPS